MRHFSKITYHLQSASKLFVSCGLLTIGAAQADLDDWYYNQHKAASAPVDVAAESTAKNLVERPNFSGTWLLDKSASDNPEEVFKESLVSNWQYNNRRIINVGEGHHRRLRPAHIAGLPVADGH